MRDWPEWEKGDVKYFYFHIYAKGQEKLGSLRQIKNIWLKILIKIGIKSWHKHMAGCPQMPEWLGFPRNVIRFCVDRKKH